MKHYLKAAFVFIAILVSNLNIASAQKFKDGYYIKKNSDTIKGLISRAGIKDLEFSFKFREEKKKPVQLIHNYEVLGYKIGLEVYEPILYEGEVRFLEVVEQGKLNLYKITEKVNRSYSSGFGENTMMQGEVKQFYWLTKFDDSSRIKKLPFGSYRKRVEALFEYYPDFPPKRIGSYPDFPELVRLFNKMQEQ